MPFITILMCLGVLTGIIIQDTGGFLISFYRST